mmetsp:Transcript_34427/g.79688  ORF Transcript_34427/g.79688 Transcript_34427/m.79688 type:complete len:430 (-) Transcript_34427:740-2029(-)
MRYTPPRRASRRMTGLVIPWVLLRRTIRWRLAPPFPSPSAPPPLPDILVRLEGGGGEGWLGLDESFGCGEPARRPHIRHTAVNRRISAKCSEGVIAEVGLPSRAGGHPPVLLDGRRSPRLCTYVSRMVWTRAGLTGGAHGCIGKRHLARLARLARLPRPRLTRRRMPPRDPACLAQERLQRQRVLHVVARGARRHTVVQFVRPSAVDAIDADPARWRWSRAAVDTRADYQIGVVVLCDAHLHMPLTRLLLELRPAVAWSTHPDGVRQLRPTAACGPYAAQGGTPGRTGTVPVAPHAARLLVVASPALAVAAERRGRSGARRGAAVDGLPTKGGGGALRLGRRARGRCAPGGEGWLSMVWSRCRWWSGSSRRTSHRGRGVRCARSVARARAKEATTGDGSVHTRTAFSGRRWYQPHAHATARGMNKGSER